MQRNMLSDARENVEFSAKVLNASTYPLSVEDDLPIDEFLFVQRSFNPFEIAACLTLLHFSKIVFSSCRLPQSEPNLRNRVAMFLRLFNQVLGTRG